MREPTAETRCRVPFDALERQNAAFVCGFRTPRGRSPFPCKALLSRHARMPHTSEGFCRLRPENRTPQQPSARFSGGRFTSTCTSATSRSKTAHGRGFLPYRTRMLHTNEGFCHIISENHTQALAPHPARRANHPPEPFFPEARPYNVTMHAKTAPAVHAARSGHSRQPTRARGHGGRTFVPNGSHARPATHRMRPIRTTRLGTLCPSSTLTPTFIPRKSP